MIEQVEILMLPDGRLRPRDAAAYLGVTPKTLASWRCAGDGPSFIKLGRIFYYKQDLDAWVQRAVRVTSTAEARWEEWARSLLRHSDFR